MLIPKSFIKNREYTYVDAFLGRIFGDSEHYVRTFWLRKQFESKRNIIDFSEYIAIFFLDKDCRIIKNKEYEKNKYSSMDYSLFKRELNKTKARYLLFQVNIYYEDQTSGHTVIFLFDKKEKKVYCIDSGFSDLDHSLPDLFKKRLPKYKIFLVIPHKKINKKYKNLQNISGDTLCLIWATLFSFRIGSLIDKKPLDEILGEIEDLQDKSKSYLNSILLEFMWSFHKDPYYQLFLKSVDPKELEEHKKESYISEPIKIIKTTFWKYN